MPRLDRNVNENGMGKYALVLMRKVAEQNSKEVWDALDFLEARGVLDYGHANTARDFFLIRLSDPNAEPALTAYANSAAETDPEFASEVSALASRAAFLRDAPPV